MVLSVSRDFSSVIWAAPNIYQHGIVGIPNYDEVGPTVINRYSLQGVFPLDTRLIVPLTLRDL